MKRIISLAFVLTLTAVMVLTLTACGGNGDSNLPDLSGTYTCSDLMFAASEVTFNDDGTLQITMDHYYSGTYKKSGDQYVFAITGGSTSIAAFEAKETQKGYKLTASLNADGTLTVYAKAKSGYTYFGSESAVFKKK